MPRPHTPDTFAPGLAALYVDPPPRNTHGGRRPGAGAPRGNANALRHGRRSRRLAKLHRQLHPRLQACIARAIAASIQRELAATSAAPATVGSTFPPNKGRAAPARHQRARLIGIRHVLRPVRDSLAPADGAPLTLGRTHADATQQLAIALALLEHLLDLPARAEPYRRARGG
jgi:hypothetical protein